MKTFMTEITNFGRNVDKVSSEKTKKLNPNVFCSDVLLSCRNSVKRVVSLKKVGNLLSHDLSALPTFSSYSW